MSGQRLKLVWEGEVGTKDTQETWEWNRKVGTAEITRYTVLRETGGGSGEYGIQVEGINRGTEVENWDQFKRTEIRGVRSELKGLISDSAKTLVIMNKEL